MDANRSPKYVSCGVACVDFGLRQGESEKCDIVSLSLSHTHKYLYLLYEESQGVTEKYSHSITDAQCQMDIYRFLCLILSLDKLNQSVSQLHTNL